jgi:hypothetical protein
MHEHAAYEARIAQAEDRGQGAAGGKSRNEDALAPGAIAAAYRDDLRGDDSRLPVAALGVGLEPVPAAEPVRRIRLLGQQHQHAVAIRVLDDVRERGERFRRLPAAVAEHEERRAPPARKAARDVHEVLAARLRERRRRDRAAPRFGDAGLEAAGRDFAAEEPADEAAKAGGERRKHARPAFDALRSARRRTAPACTASRPAARSACR